MGTVAEIKADFFALAKQFCGQWVALDATSHDVVASGATAQEALKSAESKGHRKPIIFKVLDNYGALAPCLAG